MDWARQMIIPIIQKPLYASSSWYVLFHVATHFPVFSLFFFFTSPVNVFKCQESAESILFYSEVSVLTVLCGPIPELSCLAACHYDT